jgi:hypothetical protein
MLLQNRNAFGHAFIKDIAGNAGDKPLQPTFPDKGGRLRSLLFFTLQSQPTPCALSNCSANMSSYA